MFKVLVADTIPSEGLEMLKKSMLVEVTQKSVKEAEHDLHTYQGLIVRSATKVTEELMHKMSSLKVIGRAGVGIDNVNIDQASKRGILVVNTPNGNTISTAEHTFAMISSLLRNIPQANISLKKNEWKRADFIGSELYGKTLGIIGFGRIGSEIAKRAKVFGMNVMVFDPFLNEEKANSEGVLKTTFNEVLAGSDIITVHTPLNQHTKWLLNKDTISITKPGVRLINCARGGIIEESALLEALETGHVAGAALDVFEVEPPINSSLVDHPAVITTPHLGASTKEAQLRVAQQIAQEILRFAKGEDLTTALNFNDVNEKALVLS